MLNRTAEAFGNSDSNDRMRNDASGKSGNPAGPSDEPAFSQMFVSHILARNARVEEDLADQLFNSTEKRLARLLLLLANFGKEGRTEPILAKISQETLAEMIGTTRSRVSHFMNKFRKLGFIDYNGHLEVHNSLVSVLLADQPRTVSPNSSSQREISARPDCSPRRPLAGR